MAVNLGVRQPMHGPGNHLSELGQSLLPGAEELLSAPRARSLVMTLDHRLQQLRIVRVRHRLYFDEVVVQAGEEGVRFLLVSGQPIEEPVAWRGPIVMNTTEQLQQAYSELRAGTFIK